MNKIKTNNLHEALAEANNSRNLEHWQLLLTILDENIRDRLPVSGLPYDDITAEEVKLLLGIKNDKDDQRVVAVKKNSILKRFWRK